MGSSGGASRASGVSKHNGLRVGEILRRGNREEEEASEKEEVARKRDIRGIYQKDVLDMADEMRRIEKMTIQQIFNEIFQKLKSLEDKFDRLADCFQEAPSQKGFGLKMEKGKIQMEFDDAPSLVTRILPASVASRRTALIVLMNCPSSQLAIEGSSVVFHMDAADPSLHNFYLNYRIIVQGTKNVITACQECKVDRLIYNSTADVVFDGIHDLHNGDESLPYPWRYEDMLSDLKAQAEALVLFANTSNGLLTCALRPSNAFGPGDPHLVPFLVTKAKSGWAKFASVHGSSGSIDIASVYPL
ncbi:hypothetical protein HHK36_019950 [Tetracentron sinense]|uniref:3-beta hydroxysteroid dehydrogenase/isomerase domain-containing protein n=1 Tax=Tetracentron sinense TaxID=13715 RepID=A0A835DAH8_TETSI|nr:hypothetical protein HHK36_019950 [Tetracentron sinense]